jgi:hypothetical protein
MKMSKRIFLLACLLVIAMVLLLAVGCDPVLPITYENRTSSTLWIDVDCVPHEFTGPYTPQEKIWDLGPIPPGESRTFEYMGIPLDRELGEHIGKYVISAIVKEGDDTVGTVIWQRIYTWTELDNIGWKVIIELE